jgi:predicted GIY-YIG superfamily endonuclease
MNDSTSKDTATKKHWWLYVLELEQGKYYVGITSKTPEERSWEHQHKVRAAYWTMKYPPLKIIHTEDLGSVTKQDAEKRENTVVREQLLRFGTNNVRGGDLRDISEYTIIFNTIYDKERLKDAFYGILIVLLLFVFLIDKYLYGYIPGGV